MHVFPLFLSVVVVVKNQFGSIESIISNATTAINKNVTDYELIIIDNASSDDSVNKLKQLTSQDGYPNLQVYALTKEIDFDTAIWVGLENALGDFALVFDPTLDDLVVLPEMLEKAVLGNDVVFGLNEKQPNNSLAYRAASSIFNNIYKWFNDVDLAKESPQMRILSKRVINFILQHAQPSISYRHLPATAGFLKEYIKYSSPPKLTQPKKLTDSIERGVQLIISTTRAPMRLATFLSLFGAGTNLIYSLYVVMVGLFQENVAAGWVSMSLQMSGMFFLISAVLFVLGEYILHMTELTNERPKYHVGQEFTSAKITRLDKLNIEESTKND